MKAIRILVFWPHHFLDGKIVKGKRTRFATKSGVPLGKHGECFSVETEYGKFAIPVEYATVLTVEKAA